MLNAKAVFLTLIFAVAFLFTLPAYGHEYNKGYISWGVDEFELLGLTQNELSQQFKNKLTFAQDYSHAGVDGSCDCRQFVLTFQDKPCM